MPMRAERADQCSTVNDVRPGYRRYADRATGWSQTADGDAIRDTPSAV